MAKNIYNKKFYNKKFLVVKNVKKIKENSKNKMSKKEQCVAFQKCTSESDNLLEIVEFLVENKNPVDCVFKSKTPCVKKSTTPFGFCSLHASTKKGKELTTLWSSSLELLEGEGSSEKPAEQSDEPAEESEEESLEKQKEGKYVEMESDESSIKIEQDELKKYNITKKSPNHYQLPLKKTETGLFVHKASGLVFNVGTGYTYGTIAPDGVKVFNLTESDIEFCKKYYIKYRSPF